MLQILSNNIGCEEHLRYKVIKYVDYLRYILKKLSIFNGLLYVVPAM